MTEAVSSMYHLLIVDDEASVVDSLADTLPWQSIGITNVFKAYSGYEALEIMKMNSVDLMITDIHMPGMSGLELLETVGRHWKKTKCMLLSGHADFQYAQHAIQHNTVDYLLKPISDQDIMTKVSTVVEQLRLEREQNITVQKAMQAFREHLPRIRGELLNELLQGRRFSEDRLVQKLDMLAIPIQHSDRCLLMLVRLEDYFNQMDASSLSLIEYAIGNMADEIFEGWYVWPCKDVHEYLAFLVFDLQENEALDGSSAAAEAASDRGMQQFQLMAAQLQNSIKHYLKGAVSILASSWAIFPDNVHHKYQGLLASLRKQLGESPEMFITVVEEEQPCSIRALQVLYEPPLLVHLLESNDWASIEDKFAQLFEEFIAKETDLPEYYVEAYFYIYSAFSSFAHKNGRMLSEIIGASLADPMKLQPGRSLVDLRKWTEQMIEMTRGYMDKEMKTSRETTVDRIKAFVQKYLAEDVSLQAIAEHMFMHPVHVSRIYKLETGDNLSDYVYRLKMERAVKLLANASLRSSEVALQLGYQNQNYFIKVFKKYYSLTPQEYRQRLIEGK